MVAEPALRVTNLSVSRGRLPVVRDATFDLEIGTCTGLIGLNGAGKSSLLASLAGLLPGQGGVAIGGEDVSRLSSWDRCSRGLILVPAGRQLFSDLSVQDNLLLGGHLQPKADRQSRLEEVLDLFPILREKVKQKAREMSGGQQQMLALGRGLMANPNVFLLDEPSEGLAPVVVDQVFAAVAQLRDRGDVAILIAEQNSGAADICDRLLLMKEGEIQPEQSIGGAGTAALSEAMFGH